MRDPTHRRPAIDETVEFSQIATGQGDCDPLGATKCPQLLSNALTRGHHAVRVTGDETRNTTLAPELRSPVRRRDERVAKVGDPPDRCQLSCRGPSQVKG